MLQRLWENLAKLRVSESDSTDKTIERKAEFLYNGLSGVNDLLPRGPIKNKVCRLPTGV